MKREKNCITFSFCAQNQNSVASTALFLWGLRKDGREEHTGSVSDCLKGRVKVNMHRGHGE